MNWDVPPIDTTRRPPTKAARESDREESPRAVCPVCGGQLAEVHQKIVCIQCHSIIETCCD
jgi:hypothetical protein